MPHLRFFGRQWEIGSDDLVMPATIDLGVTGIWFGKALYNYLTQSQALQTAECRSVSNFYTYSLILSGLDIALILGLMHASFQGTLINWWPRRRVGKLIGAKLVLQTLGLPLTGAATWLLYSSLDGCDDNTTKTVTWMVKTLWAVSTVQVLTLGYLLGGSHINRKLHLHGNVDLQQAESVRGSLGNAWSERLHSVGRLLGLEANSTLNRLSTLFAEFFEEHVDIVPSDILSALLLLNIKQAESRKEAKRKLLQTATDLRSGVQHEHVGPQDWMTVDRASYFMRFADGCYGWPYYVYSSPLAAWGLLKVILRSRYIPRALPDYVVDDDRFLSNTTVIRLLTGLGDQQFVYVCYRNKLHEVPFYVALDHKYKSIVVAVRGTLSLEDVLTDLDAFESEDLNLKGVENVCVHEGMLRAAQYIQTQLTDDSCHQALLQKAKSMLQKQVGEDEAKKYELVITGHSLGAGVASILALLMREDDQYRNLKCFAFSPPGGLVSQSASRYARTFILSVVLGDDIVSRLGLRNIYDFKASILEIIKNCDTPKHVIFGRWVERWFSRLLRLPKEDVEKKKKPPSWLGVSAAEIAVREYQDKIQQALDYTDMKRNSKMKLYPAGWIMHVEETIRSTSFLRSTRVYETNFVPADSGLFSEILISADMIRHHTPWEVLGALNWLSQHSSSQTHR